MIHHLTSRMAAGILITAALAGCGGGNGNASLGVSAAASAALSGTVQSTAGTALAGYTVVYDLNAVNDPAAALTATTDGQGHYALTVPARDITGTDTLSFFDTFGSLAATQAVTPLGGAAAPPLTTTITLTPPMPAPLAVKK